MTRLTGPAESQPLDHEKWDRERERRKREELQLGDDMKMSGSGSDNPWTIIAVVIGVIVNIVTVAWWGGKFDNRLQNAEVRIEKLETKADKDSEQDVKIAVITSQLATINGGIGEIKGRLQEITK